MPTKNKIRTIACYLASMVAVILVSGCATAPDKLWRLDDKPLAAKEQAAMLGYGSSKAFPNQIATRWTYHVKQINGKPFPKGKAYVQLDPGEYTVTLACGARFSAQDAGWFEGEYTTTLKVEAGKTYWAWIGAHQDGYKRENGGMTTTAGRCWATGFNGSNPFFDVSH